MEPVKQHRLTRIGPVLLDAENLQTMRQLAEAHDRSLAGEIRYAIGLYVKQHLRQQATQQAGTVR